MDDYEIVKEVARNHLIPALKEKLGKFAHDLVESMFVQSFQILAECITSVYSSSFKSFIIPNSP